MSPLKPPNTEKTTKNPTVRNAASLTRDSAATATIRPSWCSVASIWRVPNRTANVAIVNAMMKAVSVGRLRCWSEREPSSASTEMATAFSCSAI